MKGPIRAEAERLGGWEVEAVSVAVGVAAPLELAVGVPVEVAVAMAVTEGCWERVPACEARKLAAAETLADWLAEECGDDEEDGLTSRLALGRGCGREEGERDKLWLPLVEDVLEEDADPEALAEGEKEAEERGEWRKSDNSSKSKVIPQVPLRQCEGGRRGRRDTILNHLSYK